MNIKKIAVEEVNCPLCDSKENTFLTTGKDYEYYTCSNIFRMVKCKECKNIFLNPRPKVEEIKKLYPPNYYIYSTINNQFSLAKSAKSIIENKQIKLYLKLLENRGRILEIGSGNGILLSKLKSRKSNLELEGIDLNTQGNALARRPGLTIYDGLFEEVGFPENSYDLIIMNQVLEHVPELAEVIKKIKKILKPDKFLVIETPCLYSWDYQLFKNSFWGGYHFPRHFNLFSRATLRQLLERHNFKIIKEESLLNPSFWILSIHNLLVDNNYPEAMIKFFNFYNPLLLTIFTLVDLSQKLLGRPTSAMRIIARKE